MREVVAVVQGVPPVWAGHGSGRQIKVSGVKTSVFVSIVTSEYLVTVLLCWMVAVVNHGSLIVLGTATTVSVVAATSSVMVVLAVAVVV